MSTSYQRLKPPITSVRVMKGPGHSIVTVFMNGANTGNLTLRNEEVCSFLWAISEDRDCAVHVSSQGIQCNGTVDPEECLISEEGDITSLATLLREEQNAKLWLQ